MLSIRISEVNGQVVKSIININWSNFVKKLIQLALISVPAAFSNSLIEYMNKKIALKFRENLTKYFHKVYLNDMMFYHVGTIDARIQNPDQRLTQDLDKWANSLSAMYSNLSKPILDIILFSRKLSTTLGWQGPCYILGYYVGATMLQKYISPSFGKLVAVEQKLEGEFRACHTNVNQHSEEIGFYRGDNWERKKVNATFDTQYDHSQKLARKRSHIGIIDSMQIKYGAVMIGYAVLGIPVFGKGKDEYLKNIGEASNITRDYIKNASQLVSLAKALGRVVISYKEVQELAGFTSLVSELKDVIDQIQNGFYNRNFPNPPKDLMIKEQLTRTNEKIKKLTSGDVSISNCIMMDDVPLLAPNGDELGNKVNLLLKEGMSCLVVGPNGCGKTSLYRILGGLWPLFGGKMQRPKAEDILYLPQRAYLPKGTLRDLIIYPDIKQRKNDDELLKIIQDVALENLLAREEDGWETKKDWIDLQSGGERQRISFARLFYHLPKFAILDEATSAVSIDIEGTLYMLAKQKNITFFTVSQRNTLFEYHDYLLKFDGNKDWTFEQIMHSNPNGYGIESTNVVSGNQAN